MRGLSFSSRRSHPSINAVLPPSIYGIQVATTTIIGDPFLALPPALKARMATVHDIDPTISVRPAYPMGTAQATGFYPVAGHWMVESEPEHFIRVGFPVLIEGAGTAPSDTICFVGAVSSLVHTYRDCYSFRVDGHIIGSSLTCALHLFVPRRFATVSMWTSFKRLFTRPILPRLLTDADPVMISSCVVLPSPSPSNADLVVPPSTPTLPPSILDTSSSPSLSGSDLPDLDATPAAPFTGVSLALFIRHGFTIISSESLTTPSESDSLTVRPRLSSSGDSTESTLFDG